MKKIIVKQHDLRDCGPCCLLSIIRYYNGDIPLEHIKLDAKTDNNGTNAYNLVMTANKYGFSSCGIKVDNIDSRDILLPCIAHIILKNGLEHYIVIYKIDKDTITIMDPAIGYQKILKEDFNKVWTKVIILLQPNNKIPIINKQTNIKNMFINCLTNEKTIIFKILFNSIVISSISLIISYYLQIAITIGNYINNLIYVIIIFIMLNILKIYLNYIRNEYIIYLNKNIDKNIIMNFIKHIFKLPLYVIKNREAGEILTRVYELNTIKELFSEIFVSFFLDFIIFIISIYFLYSINRSLFIILCLTSILYLLLGIIVNPFIYKKINNNIDLHTDFNSSLVEKINSIISIRNLNITEYITNGINEKFNKYINDTLNYQNFMNKYILYKDYIKEIGLFIITSLGLIYVYQGKIDLIYLITFNSIANYYFEPIKNSVDLLPKLNLIKLYISKIEDFINIEEEKIGNKELFYEGDIKIEKLTYSYNNDKEIIKNLDIKINKGTHLTIRGNSGSGKSTICQCLSRNIEDYQGYITIKDINIKDYSLNTIKNNIIYVSQIEKLFTDTIYNNIVLEQKLTKEELNEVLKITCVDEILKKRKIGLETLLIDGGINLSGGERQRIILARALVRKPKIIILDESLSEVDLELELKILLNLDRYLKDKIIIYVSHSNLNVFKKEYNLGV